MLCKVSDETVTGHFGASVVYEESGNKDVNITNSQAPLNLWTNETGSSKDVTVTVNASMPSGRNYITSLSIGGTTVKTQSAASTISGTRSYTVNANTTVQATVGCSVTSTNRPVTYGYRKVEVAGYDAQISKNYNNKGKPRELKEISQKATTTIFGVHIDNTRITQD